MTLSPADETQYIDAISIRKLFNESQLPDMIDKGQLSVIYLRNKHLTDPSAVGEPWCTHAQMIRYLDQNGSWLVEVFQYLRADGSIGASGKADPKRIRLHNKVYILEIQIPT